jgi:NAD(P)H dehydrogenase (quinone)
MTDDRRQVLVTGATGNVGRAVLRQLSGDTTIQLSAGVRSLNKAVDFGVPVVHLDYDKANTIAPALEGVDCMLMVTAYTVDKLLQGKILVDEAKKAGVKYIVHLGSPGNDDTRIAHYGWQQLVERYIEWSGISYTHIRPQIFMQNLLGYGGTGIVDRGIIRQYVGEARLSWIDSDDIALVASICLRSPQEHFGKTYRLGYEAWTYAEVASILTRVIGQPFVYEPRPASEFLEKALAAGAEPVYMRSVYENYLQLAADVGPGVAEVFENFEAITGRRPTTMEGFAAARAARFKY